VKVGDLVRHIHYSHLGLGIYLGKNHHAPDLPTNVLVGWYQWGSKGTCDKNELEVICK